MTKKVDIAALQAHAAKGWGTDALIPKSVIELICAELQDARATPADQDTASQQKFEWARKAYDVSESRPGELQRFWDCALKAAGGKND